MSEEAERKAASSYCAACRLLALLCAAIALLNVRFVVGVAQMGSADWQREFGLGRAQSLGASVPQQVAVTTEDVLRRLVSTPEMTDAAAARIHLDLAADTEDVPWTRRRMGPCGAAGVERLGNAGDGGWDICSGGLPPSVLAATDPLGCIVYSVGTGTDFSFDTDVAARSDCAVSAFDNVCPSPRAIHFTAVLPPPFWHPPAFLSWHTCACPPDHRPG